MRRAGAKTYLIMSGTNTPGAYGDVDHRFDSWPAPVIAAANGWIGKRPARSLIEGGYQFSKPDLKHGADALLYLGPRDRLISVSMTRAQLAGMPYGEEIMRTLENPYDPAVGRRLCRRPLSGKRRKSTVSSWVRTTTLPSLPIVLPPPLSAVVSSPAPLKILPRHIQP